MAYFYLLAAIFCEVLGTMLLPISNNFTKIIPTTILSISYILAFYFLTFALKNIPIAIVYASWSALVFFNFNFELLFLRSNFKLAICFRVNINRNWSNYDKYLFIKNFLINQLQSLSNFAYNQ